MVVGDNELSATKNEGKLLAILIAMAMQHVLGACWGTEELGWNERSREEITRREITIKWI